MSVLKGKGSNGKEPGPQVPVPPSYISCIAEQRAHPSPAVANQKSPTDRQLKAFCEFEYQRFKLKALYLLIGHQWITGEAKELHVHVREGELHRQLTTFERAVAPSKAGFERVLRFWRANRADVLLSLEDEQLIQTIEAKITAGARSEAQRQAALASFGRAYKRRWLARTSCARGYLVPICRNFKPPKEPAALVPPSVPLTDQPAGA